MTSRLIDSLATTDALADSFSDEAVLRAMLDFEVALAGAAADAGAIPSPAADAIARAARTDRFDAAAIAREARQSGTVAMPFVRALIDAVRRDDAGSVDHVHFAATSQDVTDSALVLLLLRAKPAVAGDHERLVSALRVLSESHAATVMLGRTLMQPAVPITFGLRAAGWHAAAGRSWRRLSRRWDEAMVVQFGGAAGTRAAAGEHGEAIERGLATRLGLRPAAPWHTERDGLGALIAAAGLYCGVLGKIARDLALLMQHEVGEVSAAGGGSSTMPHKRNPAGCAIAIAAATRMPGLVAAFLTGMVQEHERSLGAGQAEWPTIAAAVQTTGAAVAALADVAGTLTVDAERMRANLDATKGVVFAERAAALLRAKLGRDEAQRLVTSALQRTRESGEPFGDVLRNMPDVAAALGPDALAGVDRVDACLGDAERLRRRLLRADEE